MMNFKAPNGYWVTTDGECYTLTNIHGQVMLSYHPMQGEVIPLAKCLPPANIVALREDLEYARGIISGDGNQVQSESELQD